MGTQTRLATAILAALAALAVLGFDDPEDEGPPPGIAWPRAVSADDASSQLRARTALDELRGSNDEQTAVLRELLFWSTGEQVLTLLGVPDKSITTQNGAAAWTYTLPSSSVLSMTLHDNRVSTVLIYRG